MSVTTRRPGVVETDDLDEFEEDVRSDLLSLDEADEPVPDAEREEAGATPEAIASILLVCTGNIGRSPFMELMLRKLLDDQGLVGVEVSSAGTQAIADTAAHRIVVEALAARGIDASEFRARPLTRELVESADLVVTASRSHRDAAGRMVPARRDRTFTLLQLHRLLSCPPVSPRLAAAATPVERLVAIANANRGRAGAGSRRDDIPDPMGRGSRAFHAMFGIVEQPLAALVEALADQPQPSGDGHG